MRKLLLSSLFVLGCVKASYAQVLLPTGTTTLDFNSISSGLPTGFTVTTGATASSLGTAATFNTAQVAFTSTTGQFGNYASATGLTSASTTTAQNASTDRAVGLRQTGTFGDPGAAFNYNFATTGNNLTSISVDLMMLSVQGRSTTFSLQYGIGPAPTSFVTLGTYADPGTFGTTAFSFTATDFGTALNDVPNATFRVVALAAATGSNSRDTVALDNLTFNTVAVPEPSSYVLLFGAMGMMALVICRKTAVRT